jgi:hypothetical protein
MRRKTNKSKATFTERNPDTIQPQQQGNQKASNQNRKRTQGRRKEERNM